jgi:hypothetical protein
MDHRRDAEATGTSMVLHTLGGLLRELRSNDSAEGLGTFNSVAVVSSRHRRLEVARLRVEVATACYYTKSD